MNLESWVSTAVQLLAPLIVPVPAVFITLFGNRHLQSVLGRRLREVDDLKQRLYSILQLAGEYWAIRGHGPNEREILEVRILAEKQIIASKFVEMGRHSRKLRNWYTATREKRLDLFDALTGGCFQQNSWSPDPTRLRLAASIIESLVSSLNEASRG